jgi:hypothetical protein
LDDLVRIVGLWDLLKQRTAVSSLVYYARHVEKNSSLAERIDAFLETAAKRGQCVVSIREAASGVILLTRAMIFAATWTAALAGRSYWRGIIG